MMKFIVVVIILIDLSLKYIDINEGALFKIFVWEAS